MKSDNLIRERSYAFAVRIVRLNRFMVSRGEYVLARQVLRAGTSIGANVEEAIAAQSRRDFTAKLAIASKEARECLYWLRLIRDASVLPSASVTSLLEECDQITRILTKIVKTSQESASPQFKIQNSKFKIPPAPARAGTESSP